MLSAFSWNYMNSVLNAWNAINIKIEHSGFIFLVPVHNMDFCYVQFKILMSRSLIIALKLMDGTQDWDIVAGAQLGIQL